MGKRNGKSCANCRSGETRIELIESRSGKKKVVNYVWCKRFVVRIRHAEKVCEDWT